MAGQKSFLHIAGAFNLLLNGVLLYWCCDIQVPQLLAACCLETAA